MSGDAAAPQFADAQPAATVAIAAALASAALLVAASRFWLVMTAMAVRGR